MVLISRRVRCVVEGLPQEKPPLQVRLYTIISYACSFEDVLIVWICSGGACSPGVSELGMDATVRLHGASVRWQIPEAQTTYLESSPVVTSQDWRPGKQVNDNKRSVIRSVAHDKDKRDNGHAASEWVSSIEVASSYHRNLG